MLTGTKRTRFNLNEQVKKQIAMYISIQRIYDNTDSDSGHRILVDRIWPRGISKEAADLDAWLKDFAPSASLRKWYDHDPAKWKEFQKKYRAELQDKKEEVLEKFSAFDLRKPLILLYAAKDRKHNNAVVLKEFLEENLPEKG